MFQKRVMRGFLIILVILLSLPFPWMKTRENKGNILLNEPVTDEKTDIIQIQLNLTFGGPERDYAVEGVQTTDGGFLLAGSTESYGERDSDMWLVKINANGSVEWNQTRDIFGSDWASDLIQTKDGGFLLIGTSSIQNMLPVLYWGSAWKVFANGTEDWCQSYYYLRSRWQADEHCFLNSVIQTVDGGFLLSGYTSDYFQGSRPNNLDIWLIKTFINGSVEWNQTYGSMDDRSYSVIQTIDGGFLIAGETGTYGAYDEDIVLLKTYMNGSVEWNQTYGGSESDYAISLIPTIDGGFLLAGVTNFWTNDSDICLVKTDESGSEKWNQTYGGVKRDRPSSVIQTAADEFLIVGTTESYGAGNDDIWLVKTWANGTIKWNQTLGGSGEEFGRSVIQTAADGFLIIGATNSYGVGDYDMWLVKLSEVKDTTTEVTIKTEEETIPTKTISKNLSVSDSSSMFFTGFGTHLIFVIFLMELIYYKKRKKV
ncbi:MAG: hypothetical protein ACFFB2_20530 [Promethearchaeota archaeon]